MSSQPLHKLLSLCALLLLAQASLTACTEYEDRGGGGGDGDNAAANNSNNDSNDTNNDSTNNAASNNDAGNNTTANNGGNNAANNGAGNNAANNGAGNNATNNDGNNGANNDTGNNAANNAGNNDAGDPCDACGPGEICVNDTCVNPPDPCDACGPDQVCQDDVCVDRPDPCDACGPDQICQNDVCVDVGGNNDPGQCVEDRSFTGQVSSSDEPPSGGLPTTTPYGAGYDTGLSLLLGSVPVVGQDDDATEVVENASAVDVDITDATVVATYYKSPGQSVPRANREFWIADGRATFKVFFFSDQAESFPPFNIQVGQRISLRALEVTNFEGVPEITQVDPSAWSLNSEQHQVYIEDRTGEIIGLDDVNRVVRVTGTLEGEGVGCGGNYFCYDMAHGGRVVTLRTNSQFVQSGDCVTFVGPVSAFNGTPQLNASNFDWLWTPFRQ